VREISDIFRAFTVFVIFAFATGCAGSHDPVGTELTPAAGAGTNAGKEADPNYVSNWHILGAYEMTFDPETVSLKIKPDRTIETWFDVTSILRPPKCNDCVKVEIIDWDPETARLVVKSKVRNPTKLTVFMPRVVFQFLSLDWKLEYVPAPNNSLYAGYTDHYFDGIGPERDPFTYLQAGTYIEPDEVAEQTWTFVFPGPVEEIPPFPLIIEANWPGDPIEPTSLHIIPPDPPTGALFAGGGGELKIPIRASDVQGDHLPPRIDTSPLGGGWVTFTKDPDYNSGNPVWIGWITNYSAPAGKYVLWCEVEDPVSPEKVYWPLEVEIHEKGKIVNPWLETIYNATPSGGIGGLQRWNNYVYYTFDFDGNMVYDYTDPFNPIPHSVGWMFNPDLVLNPRYLKVGDGVAAANFHWIQDDYLVTFDLESDPFPNSEHPALAFHLADLPGIPEGALVGNNVQKIFGKVMRCPISISGGDDSDQAFVSIENPRDPQLVEIIGPLGAAGDIALTDEYYICVGDNPYSQGDHLYVYRRGQTYPYEPEFAYAYDASTYRGSYYFNNTLYLFDSGFGLRCWKNEGNGNWTAYGPYEVPSNLFNSGIIIEYGDKLYTPARDETNSTWGLLEIDVSTPWIPTVTHYFEDIFSSVALLTLFGDNLLAVGIYDMRIFNMSDLYTPLKITNYGFYDRTVALDVREPICALAQRMAGLKLLDVSEPSDPEFISQIYPGGLVWDVRLSEDGKVAYIALPDVGTGVSGFKVYDISDPYNPVETAYLPWDNGLQVCISGDYLVGGGTTLGFWDISDPLHPEYIGEIVQEDTEAPVAQLDGEGGYVKFRTQYSIGVINLTEGWPPEVMQNYGGVSNVTRLALDIDGDLMALDTGTDAESKSGAYSLWQSSPGGDREFSVQVFNGTRSAILSDGWCFLRTPATFESWPWGWSCLRGYDLSIAHGTNPDYQWQIPIPWVQTWGSMTEGPELMVRNGRIWIAGGLYDLIVVRLW